MMESPPEEIEQDDRHEVPFTDEWYDKSYETFSMMGAAVEMAIVYAGYKLITAFGVMLIIVSIGHKLIGAM